MENRDRRASATDCEDDADPVSSIREVRDIRGQNPAKELARSRQTISTAAVPGPSRGSYAGFIEEPVGEGRSARTNSG